MGYDAELRRHNEALRRAVGVGTDDQILDIVLQHPILLNRPIVVTNANPPARACVG